MYLGTTLTNKTDYYNDVRRTLKVKVKAKLSLCLTKYHAMKTYWGRGSIAPCILNLGTGWR
jgi:hypothetical protein